LSNVDFLRSGEITDSLRMGWNWPEVSDRLTILATVGRRTDAHSLKSQVGMGSESRCLFGQFDRILWISDSEAGVKVEKTGGVVEGEGIMWRSYGGVAGNRQTKLRYFIGEERSEAVSK